MIHTECQVSMFVFSLSHCTKIRFSHASKVNYTVCSHFKFNGAFVSPLICISTEQSLSFPPEKRTFFSSVRQQPLQTCCVPMQEYCNQSIQSILPEVMKLCVARAPAASHATKISKKISPKSRCVNYTTYCNVPKIKMVAMSPFFENDTETFAIVE